MHGERASRDGHGGPKKEQDPFVGAIRFCLRHVPTYIHFVFPACLRASVCVCIYIYVCLFIGELAFHLSNPTISLQKSSRVKRISRN